ncbi:cytochrome C [Malaciobacter marinus]|uniref:cytochrome C n=1 Tax=Malaciobacter marinus TaxID=505249 RepID=UPI0018C881FB|nr:cytochrome C [Malaciobacter marinus]
MKRFKIILLFVLISSFATFSLTAKEIDKQTGLKIDKGFEQVKVNCTVCHSAKFITFQKGDRQTWLSMIRWMQRTQGLWEFDKKTENLILDYLEKNYPPGKASRRPNLKPKDLPKL